MAINKRFIKVAISQAKQSTHKHQIGCVIFEKQWILSAGRNYACRSAKHLHPRFTRWRGSVHAEVDAALSARCDLKGASIFVVRINKRGELRLAKPCHQCWAYLRHIKLRYCFYSTNEGTIVKEKIE